MDRRPLSWQQGARPQVILVCEITRGDKSDKRQREGMRKNGKEEKKKRMN